MSSQSTDIVNKKLRSKLKEIFIELAGSEDSFISATHINLEHISTEILLLLKPLLIEMESYEESLDVDEFIESGIALL